MKEEQNLDRYLKSIVRTPEFEKMCSHSSPQYNMMTMLGKSCEDVILNSPFYFSHIINTVTVLGDPFGSIMFQLCKN